MLDQVIDFLMSTFRLSTPLLLAAFGALLVERAGVVMIAIEGLMLVGAFFGAVVAYTLGSEWWGFLAGGLAGSLMAAVFALFVLSAKANQVVAGMAINLLASGIGPFLAKILYENSLGTPALAYDDRFFYFPSFFAALFFVALLIWFYQTPSGLWLRFAGEHPAALQAAGVSVRKVRWWAVIAGGSLAGWGGASLSLQLSSSYVADMTAGRGYMALAALILGKWRPDLTALACLLFGATDALQIRWQAGESGIPVQFVQMLPYVVTLIVLAGLVGKSRAPRASGTDFP